LNEDVGPGLSTWPSNLRVFKLKNEPMELWPSFYSNGKEFKKTQKNNSSLGI
jgi:hypothetical protein